MTFDKKLAILIDNETGNTEHLRQAIKEADPSVHCLSFQFADEAIFAMQAKLLHPEYIFFDLDDSTARLSDCLNTLASGGASGRTRVVIFLTVLPEMLERTLIHQGVYRAFQKPITKTQYKKMMHELFHHE